uniref:ANK_REP_REGION domain-containing protein n=1 Tax=Parastrongyloides trichosuri TaxID=131310 RepID=A0A0N5A3U6_PARTI
MRLYYKNDDKNNILRRKSTLQLYYLNVAIKSNRQDLVEYILCQNDKINLDSNLTRSPPICLAVQTRNIIVVNLLLHHGCDVNKLFIYDYRNIITPLIFATIFGDANIVESLLEHGADPNLTDNFHRSPLLYAVENNHLNICKILIDYGANVNLPEKNGYTPLHIACKQIKKKRKFINLLIAHGANCDQPDFMGRSCADIIIIKDFLSDDDEDDLNIYTNVPLREEVFEALDILISTMSHANKRNLYRLIQKKMIISSISQTDEPKIMLTRFVLSIITKPLSLKIISKQSLNTILKNFCEKQYNKRWEYLEKLYSIIPLEMIDYLKYKEYI